MKLTIEDLKRIQKDVEDNEILCLKLILGMKEDGWYQECLHENAGDRR